VSARGSIVVPRRRTLPASRHRGLTSSTFCLVIIAECPPYAAVDRQWPRFSGRRPSCWNSLPQHVTSAPSLAIFHSFKTPLFRRCFSWPYRSLVPDKWHVITDALIVLVTYCFTIEWCHFQWPWVILSNLAKYSMTRSIARPFYDSWASCFLLTGTYRTTNIRKISYKSIPNIWHCTN